ncbi:MAG: hypothetical protein II767_12395 [Proteobacteria bacterium]|nr:hypothetical protein [Pseudomonadota bacterium]
MRRLVLCVACCVSVSAGCSEAELLECQDGLYRCSDDHTSIMRCENNTWHKHMECVYQTICDDSESACISVCKDGEHRCSADLRQVELCVGNKWVQEKVCTSPSYCASEFGLTDCREPSTGQVCLPGTRRCENNVVLVCSGTGWNVLEACTSPMVCEPLSGYCVKPQECTAGAKKCDADLSRMLVCTDGSWTVGQVCDGGYCKADTVECIAGCQTGAKKCNAEGNGVLKCEQNQWVVDQTCLSSEYCDAQKSACAKIPECQENASTCDATGKNVEICKNGAWESRPCAEGRECLNGQCISAMVANKCTAGAYDCNDNTLRKCVGDTWQVVKTCADATPMCDASKADCVNTCQEGAQKCSSSRKSLMTCHDNEWIATECKANQVCVTRNGVSAIEEVVCADGITCTNNTLRQCENNAYVYEHACLSSETCNATKKGCEAKPECSKGEYKCVGSTLYSCSVASKWQSEKTCVNPEVCDESSKKCVDTSDCKTGEYFCDGQVLKKCSGGHWANEKTCESAYSCNATQKTCVLKPVCSDGEYSCNGKTLRVCSGGQWKDSKTCSASQTCSTDLKKCIDCNENAIQCNGLALQKCVSGAWKTQKTCTSGQTCSADLEKCIECSGNVWQCSSQKLQACTEGLWTTKKTCSSSEYCDASQKDCIKKDACTTGVYSCNGSQLNSCVGGQWQLKQTCTEKENCDANAKKCVLKPVCTKGETLCENNSLKTCNAEGQWESLDCGASKLCVTSVSSSSCVTKMTLPAWCNTQFVNEDRDQGYGRLLMPQDVSIDSISAHFVCGNVNDPVASWTYVVPAVHNSVCNDCYNNTEFVSYSMGADTGSYSCVFTFDFGPQTIACPANQTAQGGSDGGEPIVLSASTKVTKSQAFDLKVDPPSSEAPAWCYFKHLDDSNHGSTWKAYARILPPGLTTPAQISARLICGTLDTPAANWTIMRNATQNLFCPVSGNDACGAHNLEYMSDALIDAEHKLNAGHYDCAFRFDVGGKSYVCKTDEQKGSDVIEIKSGTKLTTDETWGIDIN